MSALFRLFCSVSGNFPKDEDPSLLDFFCSNAQDAQQCLLCTSTLLSTIHCHRATCQTAHAAPHSLPQSASPSRSAQPGRRGFSLTHFHHKTELLALAQYVSIWQLRSSHWGLTTDILLPRAGTLPSHHKVLCNTGPLRPKGLTPSDLHSSDAPALPT